MAPSDTYDVSLTALVSSDPIASRCFFQAKPSTLLRFIAFVCYVFFLLFCRHSLFAVIQAQEVVAHGENHGTAPHAHGAAKTTPAAPFPCAADASSATTQVCAVFSHKCPLFLPQENDLAPLSFAGR